MELKQKDIPILNEILDTLVNKFPTIYTKDYGNYIHMETKDISLSDSEILTVIWSETDPNTQEEFYECKRYIDLIIHYKAVSYENDLKNGGIAGFLSSNYQTADFLEQQRFKEIFNRQEEIKDLKKVEENKLRDEAKVSKWTRKTYWYVFWASLIALCLSLNNFISGLFE